MDRCPWYQQGAHLSRWGSPEAPPPPPPPRLRPSRMQHVVFGPAEGAFTRGTAASPSLCSAFSWCEIHTAVQITPKSRKCISQSTGAFVSLLSKTPSTEWPQDKCHRMLQISKLESMPFSTSQVKECPVVTDFTVLQHHSILKRRPKPCSKTVYSLESLK